MKNITVSISDTAYLKARVWAAEHETSLSAVVAYLLETLPKIKPANVHYPLRSETPPASSSPPSPLPPRKARCETVELGTSKESAAYSQNRPAPQKL